MKASQLFRHLWKIVCLAVVCYFLGAYVVRHSHDLRGIESPRIDWVVVSCALGTLACLVYPLNIWIILRGHRHPISYLRTVSLNYIPMLGKYVPGKVWSILWAFYLYRSEGVSKRLAATCISLTLMIGLGCTAVVALTFSIVNWSLAFGVWIVILCVGVGLVCFSPDLVYATANWILRRLGKPAVDAELRGLHLLTLILGTTTGVFVYGIAFACLVRSFADFPITDVLHLVGVFASAQIIGFLALFAPAGIGVREGVLIAGLSPVVGPGPAIVISGACRLWQTAIEMLLAGVGWLAIR